MEQIDLNTKPSLGERTIFGISVPMILVSFAVWTIIGVSFTLRSYAWAVQNQREYPFVTFLGQTLLYFYLYAAASPIIVSMGSRFPLAGGKWVKSLCFHTVASIIWAPLISVASMFVVLLFGLNDCVECPPLGSLIIIYLTSPISIHQGVLAYWGIALAGEGIRYYRDMRSEKLRVTELSAQLNAAQLSALKMQIHPHFLFNTLNSIVTLINEDPATAERMILKLSNFLRMTLQSSGEPMVTLKQEFDFLRTYLDIEKVRFGDRLMTEFVYDDALLAAKIPNLLLQPLVENSIRHGINNKKSGGLINISAERNNGSLVITITDNGKVIGRGEGGTSCGGLGLKNTTERLMNIYGDDHEFEIAGNELEGTTVRVTVPYRT